jgi:hypothetical protein
MASKHCTRKEKCVNGNVLQPYSNFYKRTGLCDGYAGECKDCMAQRRKLRKEKEGGMFNDKFKLFIG